MFERKYQRFKWLMNKFVIINKKFNFRWLRLNIVKCNLQLSHEIPIEIIHTEIPPIEIPPTEILIHEVPLT